MPHRDQRYLDPYNFYMQSLPLYSNSAMVGLIPLAYRLLI